MARPMPRVPPVTRTFNPSGRAAGRTRAPRSAAAPSRGGRATPAGCPPPSSRRGRARDLAEPAVVHVRREADDGDDGGALPRHDPDLHGADRPGIRDRAAV